MADHHLHTDQPITSRNFPCGNKNTHYNTNNIYVEKGIRISSPLLYCLCNDVLHTFLLMVILKLEGRKEMFYLTMHTTHFVYCYMASDHSDSERGNPLPPHGLPFPINSKGSFICTIPQTG